MHLLHLVIIRVHYLLTYVRSNHLHLLPIYLWYLPIYVSHLSRGEKVQIFAREVIKVFYYLICGLSLGFQFKKIMATYLLQHVLWKDVYIHQARILSCSNLWWGMVCTLICPLNLSCVFYNFICGSSNLAKISPSLNCKPSFMCVHNPLTQWVFNFCNVPMTMNV
jgi:hypothetical protein